MVTFPHQRGLSKVDGDNGWAGIFIPEPVYLLKRGLRGIFRLVFHVHFICHALSIINLYKIKPTIFHLFVSMYMSSITCDAYHACRQRKMYRNPQILMHMSQWKLQSNGFLIPLVVLPIGTTNSAISNSPSASNWKYHQGNQKWH